MTTRIIHCSDSDEENIEYFIENKWYNSIQESHLSEGWAIVLHDLPNTSLIWIDEDGMPHFPSSKQEEDTWKKRRSRLV